MPVLLYLVSEDWYFWSHRLPIARAARDAGWRVVVATRVHEHGERIRREGFRLVPIRLHRSSLAPWQEFTAIAELIRLYRRERPDLVHHVALKPVIYGTLAARLSGVRATVNALGGMGFVFSSGSTRARMLRGVVKAVLRRSLNRSGSRLVLQNPDDAAILSKGVVSSERIVLIRGSGVDVKAFAPTPEPDGKPVAVMVSRMLWDKGVGDLVEAARLLKARACPLDIVLVGAPDPDNPGSIPEHRLRNWAAAGNVFWLGRRDDIARIWAESHIAVLPTFYGEGLPKSLLEAAACGRPMVASDVPGCREIVRHGVTGLLVTPRDPRALAGALQTLAEDPQTRRRMGGVARELVERELSEEIVVSKTMAVYRTLIPEAP